MSDLYSSLSEENPTLSPKSMRRAIRAIRCLPLNMEFYNDAQKKGLSAEEVFLKKVKYQRAQSKWFKKPNSLENEFIWLITLGILRREVDGQGLTEKVRVTPLTRELLGKVEYLNIQKASFIEKIKNWLLRKSLFQ